LAARNRRQSAHYEICPIDHTTGEGQPGGLVTSIVAAPPLKPGALAQHQPRQEFLPPDRHRPCGRIYQQLSAVVLVKIVSQRDLASRNLIWYILLAKYNAVTDPRSSVKWA
jgi:hypothetical protein